MLMMHSLGKWLLASAMLSQALPAQMLQAMDNHGTPIPQQSLSLDWEQQGEMITIRVIGKSNHARTLRYEMTVTGGSVSQTAGNARLVPGTAITVATVRINAKPAWTARLEVSGDENYHILAKP